MSNNQKWIGKGRFDSGKSSFMHKIYLDNGRVPLQGYNKGLFSNESPDKIIALERMIKRFVINDGYIFGRTKKYGHRTLKFELYLNGNYESVPHELLFTLYPTHYVFENNPDYTTDVRLNQFLSRLYEQAKSGEFNEVKLLHKKIITNTQDWFKMKFKKEQDLYNFMQLKIKEGHPVGLVTDFYTKYRDKHLQNC